jgi:ssDNA-binding Zn-finger/Zn-ribbon topoisomerase 1
VTRPFEPRRDRQEAVDRLLKALEGGVTLRQASATAGVHVATVCRWQKSDPGLRQELRRAAYDARHPFDLPPEPRPHVPWRRDCPLCKAKVVVRTARPGVRFWRCGRWPWCKWASWRPRAPRNCRKCGSPRYWSHSRKSIACSGCGVRTKKALTCHQEALENDGFDEETAWF